MIALRNTTNNQIFYIIHKSFEDRVYHIDLAKLNVAYTKNGTYSIFPPSGYDGISSVNVTVDVDSGCNLTTSTVTYTDNGEYTIEPSGFDGFSSVTVNVDTDLDGAYNDGFADGIADQKGKLTSTTFTGNGSYNREDGWDNVTVNVDTVTPYNNGKQDGVAEQKAKLTDIEITENGTYRREDGYKEVVVNIECGGSYEEGRQDGIAEQKSKLSDTTVTENGTYESQDGYKKVVVNVDTVTPYNNGKEAGIQEQKNKLTSETFTQNGTYTRQDGWNEVTVNLDTQSYYNSGYAEGEKDQKDKLTSLNVTRNGTYTKEDGYNSVVVNIPSDINNQNKTVSPKTTSQVITADSGYSGLGQVTVNAVTSSIDANISAGNIKKDVTILGVTGTYDPQPELETKSVTYSSNDVYTITPTTGKDGLSSVEVTVNVDTTTPYNNGYSDGEAAQKEKLTSITVTQNGTYTRADGYDEIIVNVSGGESRNNYLTLEAGDTAAIINWVANNCNSAGTEIYYSLDDGTTWNMIASECSSTSTYNTSFTIPANGKALIRGLHTSLGDGNTYYSHFYQSTATPITVSGNVMSIIQYADFDNSQLGTANKNAFQGLFAHCIGLTSAENLVLPSNVVEGCYRSMFNGCTNLTKAPVLPATTAAPYCYAGMFSGCSSLVNAPSLPATTVDNYCYQSMFRNCTSLVTAPTLPATESAEGCYQYMFQGCTSLTTAPNLPATSLAKMCYYSMFKGCTALANAPVIAATTVADSSCESMFSGCTNLETAPELKATILQANCYNHMFEQCSKLNYVKCLATDISANGCVYYWLTGVSSTGTFVKDTNTTWTSGSSGIPTGWTIQNA